MDLSTYTSLQLYTVDAAIRDNMDDGIARLADIGFTTLEAFAFVDRASALRRLFDRHGISARTGHANLVNTERTFRDGTVRLVPSHEATFGAAEALGIDVVIEPMVPAKQWTTRADLEVIADRLNLAAATAASRGMRVGYHNHDHELRSEIDGVPALEVLASMLDERVVLELDLYWAAAAGMDLAALVQRLGDRVIAVHVKDGPLRPGISTDSLPTDQVPAGSGDVPLRAALDAVNRLEYAVIEFDGQQGDIFEAVRGSYQWLQTYLDLRERG